MSTPTNERLALCDELAHAQLLLAYHEQIIAGLKQAIQGYEGLDSARVPAAPDTIALCRACRAAIGGAHGGPDAPHRPTEHGERCEAADCQGRMEREAGIVERVERPQDFAR